MLKSIILGGFVGVSFLLTTVAAHAQAQQLTSQSPNQTTSAASITPLELRQFAQIILQFQAIDQQTQKKMPPVIKEGGMSVERFLEIVKIKDDPSASTTTTVSTEEEEKFNNIITKLNKMEQDSRPKKERAIIAQGLTVQRFVQIDQIVKKDPTLQKRVDAMVGK